MKDQGETCWCSLTLKNISPNEEHNSGKNEDDVKKPEVHLHEFRIIAPEQSHGSTLSLSHITFTLVSHTENHVA